MLERGLTLSNGKGGVGKSSIVANLAGTLASDGYRILAVDLDPQTNLCMDFGVDDADAGESLKEAVMTSGKVPVTITENVRPNLDLVTAGRVHTAELADYLTLAKANQGDDTFQRLGHALASIAGDYDLILFDTPPASNSPLARLAMTASHWVISPTKRDSGSMNGLAEVAALYAVVTKQNPLLEFAGAVLFCFDPRETSEINEARARLRDEVLAGKFPVFETVIPRSEKAGKARDFGWLAVEYADEAVKDKKRRLSSLRKRRDDPGAPIRSANLASQKASEKLAEAYRSLADEIVGSLFADSAERSA